MEFSKPLLDAAAFQRKGSAEAGFLFIGACRAYMPVATIDACHQGCIAFGAPQVPADTAQAHGGVIDGLDARAIHRI